MSKIKRAHSSEIINDLRKFLLEGKTTTQDALCAALKDRGHLINQSKVSRLLRKIGAVKSRNELGEIVYRLPIEPAPPPISSQLSSLIIDVVANETLIVVNTSPGSAQLIARILDHHKDRILVLGTIAGDDTIFLAPKSVKKINDTVREIKKLLS